MICLPCSGVTSTEAALLLLRSARETCRSECAGWSHKSSETAKQRSIAAIVLIDLRPTGATKLPVLDTAVFKLCSSETVMIKTVVRDLITRFEIETAVQNA